MNRCYRVVWNAAKEKFQVASEFARQRTGGPRARTAACLVLAAGGVLGMAGQAWADGGAGGVGGGNSTPASGGIGYEGAAGDPGTPGLFVGGGGGGGGAAGSGLDNGGAGGNGGVGTAPSGGGGPGGTSGAPNGQDGVDGTSTSGNAGGGGGGGGGGYSGAVFDSNPSLSGDLTGGTGGKGGNGGLSIASPISYGGGGGGGGAGGYGAIVTATGANFSNSYALTGGDGGDGGAGGVAIFPGTGGNGGAGGDGLYIANGGATIDNTGPGAITGGAGGAGGSSVLAGISGTGGAGLRGNDLQLTNGATISGGKGGTAPTGIGAGGTGGAGIAGDNLQITNNGTILGGDGGAATGGASVAGVGGAGVIGTGLVISNAGTISGGWNGTARADAIHFTGGANTLTLEGAGWNLYGNLEIDSGSLTFNQATDQTVVNVITGGGSVVQDGDGILTLSGANTYSGGTTVQDSMVLAVGNDHALGTGMVTLGSDATLSFGEDGLNLANNFTLNNIGNFTTNAGQAGTISGVIGDGSTLDILHFTGDGKLVLTGVNTYTGQTWIDSGTLALSGAGSIASSSGVDICDCGTFDISATDNGATIQDLTGEGRVELGSKTLTLSAPGGLGYDGLIEGDGGLAVTGGGLGGLSALALSGNNTYRGGTSIGSYAAVAAASNTALGTGPVSMADTSGLVFFGEDLNLANDFKLSGDASFLVPGGWTATLSGVIGDGTSPGTLDYAGGGTLVLTNVNTYTGPTLIGADTLALSGAGSIASSSGVEFDSCGCGDGIFDISATDNGATIQSLSGDDGSTVVLGSKTLTLSNASGDYAGTITGTGGLVISGGQEYLTGINTYQGGTTIRGGAMLSVGSDQSLGDPVGGLTFDDGTLDVYNGFSSARPVTLAGDGVFYLDGGSTLALSGQISGPGGLTVTGDGSGKVVLSHANTYTGPTQIEAGTLALSGAGSIAASSGVDICDCGVFDISAISSGGATIQSLSGEGQVKLGGQTLTLSNASGTYAGVISGTGGLVLDGGQETLNGSNTYTGGTAVNGGTLSVGDADHPSASIQGDVQVSAAGTLRGHGSIAGNVDSTGMVWPGGSIGTLTIGGNYTQSSSGTLQIEISPTAASQLKVGGTATLAGTLSLLYAPGTYTSTSYTLLSAKTVNGSFATVKSNAPASVAESVAYAADAVSLGLTSTVVAPTQATIFGAVGSSALRAGQGANEALLDRLAGPCGTDSSDCPRQGNGLWIQAHGTDTRIDGNHGAPDARDRRYGFLTGVDHQWKGWTVGVAGGYSHADVTESGNGSKGTLDTLRLAGYGAKNIGAYTLAGTLGYAYDFSSTTRSFGALGSAKGDGHGQEFTAGLQASRPWSLGPVVLTPRVGVRYAYLDGLGTDETGPTAQNLGVSNQHLQSLQPYVGVTLDYPFTLRGNDRPASVQLRAGYAYETQSTGRNVSVTAADGTGFVIAGTRDTRGLVTAGLGATLPIGKSASAYVRYDSVLHTGNVNAQSLQAGVDYRF